MSKSGTYYFNAFKAEERRMIRMAKEHKRKLAESEAKEAKKQALEKLFHQRSK